MKEGQFVTEPSKKGCVARSVFLICFALSFFGNDAFGQTTDAGNVPEAYEEPGENGGRLADASIGVESIDPFTGALKLVVTDLVIPSNGGLPLQVVRNYQSFQKVSGVAVPERNYQKGRTATGIGWDLHFGRLWRGNNSGTATQLEATDTVNGCQKFNQTSRDNPVLELPDGSRQTFAVATESSSYAYISPQRWILKCLPTGLNNGTGNGGAIVISPEGIKYTFNFLHRVSNLALNQHVTQTQSNYAFHVTKIEHPNGTYITVTYLPTASSYYASLATVAHSEGQSVTFTYSNPSSQTAAHLQSFYQTLPAGEGGQRTWVFNYATNGWADTSEYLQSVSRPDGRQTAYEYYPRPTSTSANPDGVFSLKKITTPLGGSVAYTYVQQTFSNRDALAVQPYYVVSTKTVRRLDSGSISGVWTYHYQPAPAVYATQDVTWVDGPTSCVKYRHDSAMPVESKWRIGLLVTKSVSDPNSGSASDCETPIRTETYTWIGALISTQGYFRPPGHGDSYTYAARLSGLSVQQDGTTYSTAYNNPDTYGNPAQIVESGWKPASNGASISASRTTNRTYFTDTSVWIINRLKNETVVNVGPTYATPGSSPVTTDHVVARTFFTSGSKIGLLQQESRAGVITNFDYYTGSTSGGELSSVEDANGAATGTTGDYVTTYSNYKRGVAQLVSRSIDGTGSNLQNVNKVIGSSGLLLSYQDGEGNTTGYAYDLINRLTGITTARTDDTNVSVTRSVYGTNDVVTRGTYKETREFDGFGALTRTDWVDTTPGTFTPAIYAKKTYDADGRILKAYPPNELTLSEQTTYDGLGRPKVITHPDFSTVRFDYQGNNRTQVTDERGFKTWYYFRSFGEPSKQELMFTHAESGDAPGSGTYRDTYIDRNLLGQVLSVVQQGVTRSFKYNTKFFLFQEDHPEVGAVVYTHDQLGNVLTKKVGAATATSYTLDRLYRTDFISYPDPTGNVDLEYYKNDLLKSTTKGTGTRWDYLYDANKNLKRETLTLSATQYATPRTYQFDYTLDARDSRQTVAYPSGLAVDYVPDVFGRPTRINATQGGAAITGFANSTTYYPNGQLQTLGFPNGLSTSYGQDSRLRMNTLVTSGTINGVSQQQVNRLYGYDTASNTTSITDNLSSPSNKGMSYDGLNRLRTANGGWGGGSNSYYPTDNINVKTAGSQNLTLAYDATNRLTSTSGSQALAFAYDVYGNVTSTGRATYGNYVFDDDSLMRFVKNADTTTVIENTYDGNRHLVMENYSNGSSKKYKAYGLSGLPLFDEDITNLSTKDYIYLGTRLVATRFKCTSTIDSDSDGISDCNEARVGLNKNSAADAALDGDNDGLKNLAEMQAGTDIYKADTDADGLSDTYESSHGLNPLVSDSYSDPDGDTLTNLQEAQLGTNPTNSDTDHDGIPDNSDPNPRFNPAIIPILEYLLNN